LVGVYAFLICGLVSIADRHFIQASYYSYISAVLHFLAMEENKAGRVLAPVSQYEGNLAVGTLYASKRLIDTDPNTVRAFVAGWIETVDFIRTHKAETVKIESEITGFSESVMSILFLIAFGPLAVLFASVFGLACLLLMTCVRAIAWLPRAATELLNAVNPSEPRRAALYLRRTFRPNGSATKP